MKKSLIAAAGATLAVSAMPVVGVFAVESSFTDTVQVTVEQSCVFEQVVSGQTSLLPNNGGRTFSRTGVAPGTIVNFNAGADLDASVPTIKFYCTQAGSKTGTANYDIKAVGSQDGTPTAMTSTSGNIPTGAVADNQTGADSVWGMKVVNGASGFSSGFVAVPSTATTVQTGNASTGAEVNFTPQYRVYVGTEQASGTYEGKVTYTLSATITNNN